MRAALALAALALAVLAAGCGGADGAGPAPGSTLRATLTDPDGDGFLERGPALGLAERRELGGGGPRGPRDRALRPDLGRARARRGVARAGAVPGPARRPVRAGLPAPGGRDRPGPRRRGAGARRRAPAGRGRHGRPRRQRPGQRAGPRGLRAARGPRRPLQRRARLRGRAGGRQPGPVLLPARQRRPAPSRPPPGGPAAVHGHRARCPVAPGPRQPRRARAGRGAEHAGARAARHRAADAHRPRPRRAPADRRGRPRRTWSPRCSPTRPASPAARAR